MRIKTITIFFTSIIILTACLNNHDQTDVNNEQKMDKSTADVDLLAVAKRQQQVFEQASKAPREFREELKQACPHFNSILLTTAETIQLGTRVFNAGGTSLTNRIYEGTVYKILFTIQDDCMNLSDALQAGIAMANEKESYEDKAWALRNTLDLIMGGPPLQPPGA